MCSSPVKTRGPLCRSLELPLCSSRFWEPVPGTAVTLVSLDSQPVPSNEASGLHPPSLFLLSRGSAGRSSGFPHVSCLSEAPALPCLIASNDSLMSSKPLVSIFCTFLKASGKSSPCYPILPRNLKIFQISSVSIILILSICGFFVLIESAIGLSIVFIFSENHVLI